MQIKIRKAKIADVKDMQNFMYLLMKEEYEDFDSTNKITWAKSALCKNYFYNRVKGSNELAIIVEYEGKKIAYLSGQITKNVPYRTIKNLAILADMYVLNEYRNMKVGTMLVDEFKKWAKKRNAKIMRVQAFAHNEKTLRFYRRHGFYDYTVIFEGKV